MKRENHESNISLGDSNLTFKRLKLQLPESAISDDDLANLWKPIPSEIKMEILSNLTEQYLWGLKHDYPEAYYNQLEAKCAPENNFRVLRQGDNGSVFRSLRKLFLHQRPILRSITQHAFPALRVLSICVPCSDFTQLPAHLGLKSLKIQADTLDFSFLTIKRFPSLDIFSVSTLQLNLYSLPRTNITQMSIFCINITGAETLGDEKLPSLRVLEINERLLDCCALPEHGGLESLICQCSGLVENTWVLRKKFSRLKHLSVHKEVDLKGLNREGLDIIISKA